MKVLVIGGGGREHAIVHAISKSPKVDKIYAAPGNAGISELAECIDIKDTNVDALVTFAYEHKIDLTVVGPEASLALGIVDAFEAHGLKIFGPNKAAAQVECSKDWAKAVMVKHGIPTAAYRTFTDYDEALKYIHEQGAPIVLKYDGLAAGKGVVVAETMAEAEAALKDMLLDAEFGEGSVVIEQCLRGTEFSFMCMVDGNNVLPLPIAKDHKRAYDNDRGPNTGGMGAFSPVPLIPKKDVEWSLTNIMQRMADAMVDEGCSFSGLLYGGLMLTADGVKVIEFNARFGDPETEVVLPRVKSDLFSVMLEVASHKLTTRELQISDDACVGVVLASKGYPKSYDKGFRVVLPCLKPNHIIYHMGTRHKGLDLLTNGGRVLMGEALAPTLSEARQAAYNDILPSIYCDNLFYRSDIAKDF
ncbi:MAG: phosphoribosylamine--glycine ligase [Paludibacteraceae bacterium]|nr:phosphoribosylamine--glycine ligase [Paludibacteraceae bacterium]